MFHSCIFAAEKNTQLFRAFIDHNNAFDSVQRGLFVEKTLNSGVNGKVLNLIRDTYAKAKSCVKTRHDLSKRLSASKGRICQFCFRSF